MDPNNQDRAEQDAEQKNEEKERLELIAERVRADHEEMLNAINKPVSPKEPSPPGEPQALAAEEPVEEIIMIRPLKVHRIQPRIAWEEFSDLAPWDGDIEAYQPELELNRRRSAQRNRLPSRRYRHDTHRCCNCGDRRRRNDRSRSRESNRHYRQDIRRPVYEPNGRHDRYRNQEYNERRHERSYREFSPILSNIF